MPWVKIADATADESRYITKTKECIKLNGVKSSVTVHEGELIVSNSATPGIPKFMKITACVHDGWLIFREFNGILPEYAYYYMIYVRKRLVNTTTGSVFNNLKTDIVKNFEIKLPPIETQKQIANLLTSIDDKIELNNKIAKTLEEMAQALFKEWFVNFRFPGYEKAEFVDSELGKIPKGWEVKKLEEIANITIGRTPPRDQNQWFRKDSLGRKCVSIKDMGNGGIYVFNTSEQLTNEAVTKFRIPLIPENTVVISFKLTLGRVSITSEEMVSNEAIAHIGLKNDSNFYSEYIYLFMQRIDLANYGSTSSIGTAVNSKTVKNVPILTPTSIILQHSKKIFQPIFTQLKILELENQKLAALRDLLLPKLMNGEVSAN